VAERLLDWVSGLPTVWVYLVLAVLSCVENIFPPVPADVAVVFGAFLSRRGVTSAPLLGVLCWLANTASSVGMYHFARYHAAFFRDGRGRRLVPPGVMTALEEAYARWGVAAIFLSRFLPGVRAAVTPFAGVVGMSASRALVPAALASAIWYAFLVAAGHAVASNWEAVKVLVGDANRVLGIAAVAAALGIAFWVWRRTRASV